MVFTPSYSNVGIGANGRCSWPKMNTKELASSLARFLTATIHGAKSVSSRPREVARRTRAMELRN